MGVSGTGKTTIGEALAEKTGLPFYDADDYHPQVNIDKMRRGVPLDDADRWPWLSALNKEAGIWLKDSGGAILACSALKERYREALTRNLPGVQWIVLEADENTIARRLESRRDHFIDPGLLASQFDALESPNYGWHVDVRHSVDSIVQGIVSRMETRSSVGIVGMGVMGQNL